MLSYYGNQEEAMFEPIIFVPGILGTTLSDHYPIDHKQVYSAVWDKVTFDFDPLLLDKTGDFDLELDRLVNADELIAMVYGEMVGELRESFPIDDAGSGHAKVYVFPYDWRYPIAKNAEKLKIFIDYIIRKTNANAAYADNQISKVNLVGHSMGGCVSRYYATQLDGEKNINKLVMIAPPLTGSLYALKQLVMGETWFFDWFTREGKRKVLRTFPGVYDLLPFDGASGAIHRYKWASPAVTHETTGESVDIFDANNWQRNVEKQITKEALSKQLARSEDFFAGSGDFSPTFRQNVFIIFGTGEKTLRNVTAVGSGDDIEFDFPSDSDSSAFGDGTVPAASVYCEGAYYFGVTKQLAGNWELDLGKLAGFHASICCYPLVQNLTIAFISGQTSMGLRKIGITDIRQIRRFSADDIKNLDV